MRKFFIGFVAVALATSALGTIGCKSAHKAAPAAAPVSECSTCGG